MIPGRLLPAMSCALPLLFGRGSLLSYWVYC